MRPSCSKERAFSQSRSSFDQFKSAIPFATFKNRSASAAYLSCCSGVIFAVSEPGPPRSIRCTVCKITAAPPVSRPLASSRVRINSSLKFKPLMLKSRLQGTSEGRGLLPPGILPSPSFSNVSTYCGKSKIGGACLSSPLDTRDNPPIETSLSNFSGLVPRVWPVR